jgi:hypothetical protein
VLGDAGGNLAGSWSADEAERFADRIRPDRASLIGGSINGGSADPDQRLIFRPIPAWASEYVLDQSRTSAVVGGAMNDCGSHERIRR